MALPTRCIVFCLLCLSAAPRSACPFIRRSTRTWQVELVTGGSSSAGYKGTTHILLRVGDEWNPPIIINKDFLKGAVDVFNVTTVSHGRLSNFGLYLPLNQNTEDTWRIQSMIAHEIHRYCCIIVHDKDKNRFTNDRYYRDRIPDEGTRCPRPYTNDLMRPRYVAG